MGQMDLRRVIPAVAGAAGAGAATFALGAPLLALAPAILAGSLAAWLATEERTPFSSSAAETDDTFEKGRALLSELIEAFGDPLLLVERQQVTLANDAALKL